MNIDESMLSKLTDEQKKKVDSSVVLLPRVENCFRKCDNEAGRCR